MKTTNKTSAPLFTILALVLFGATNFKAAPGDLDPTFGNGGKVITNGNYPHQLERVLDIAIQPDGKIVVVGDGSLGFGRDFAVVRYNANGSLDTSFGTGGIVITRLGDNISSDARSVAIQADGKIVVAGISDNAATGYSFAVVRYNLNGTLDTTFNDTGKVLTPVGTTNGDARSVAIQTDGKIVVAGWGHNANKAHSAVFRYNSNGSLDTSFNGTGKIITPGRYAHSVAIQTDGKIVVAGRSVDVSSSYGFTTFRYNTNGSPDTSFGDAGRVFLSYIDIYVGDPSSSGGDAYQVAIQSDGKIVVKGELILGYDLGSWVVPLIIRYNPNGSPDTTFGINGILYFPLESDLAIQPDGKIVTVGSISNGYDFTVARYNPYGSPDTTFNGEGRAATDFGSQDETFAVAIQADGKIIVAGSTLTSQSPDFAFALARYQGGSNASPRTPFDFDSDGRADFSVFRPSDRTWYLNQSTNGFAATQFGLSTDKLAPADYDGDGRTDISVYRDGTWYWLNSSDNSFNARQFGIASDIPVPANYITGGNGGSELAVYRGGVWWILNLFNNQINTIQFGLATDKPVPADYDGDGRADCAVYRNGIWYLLKSTQGFAAVQFGVSTDKLVPADYDGDGKTDLAIYRDGVWYLQQSINGFAAFQFGVASDIPAPADYDGDGRADTAVYRENIWYLQQSAQGFAARRFGISGDKPIPGVFVP